MKNPKIFIFPIRDHGQLGKTYQILAEDGVPLGSHISSNDEYAMSDIFLHEEDFKKHYPEGYELKLINECCVDFHNALQENIKKFGKQNFDHPRNARIEVRWEDDEGKKFTTVIE